MEAAWQERWQQEHQQGPGQVQLGVNNSGKSEGNVATTAARTMVRETRQDKGNTATTMGYRGDSSGGVNSNGGDKSNGSMATTTGYGGGRGGLQHQFSASLVPMSGKDKSA